MDVPVSESFVVEDDVLSADAVVVEDELEDDEEFVGYDGSSCTSFCC